MSRSYSDPSTTSESGREDAPSKEDIRVTEEEIDELMQETYDLALDPALAEWLRHALLVLYTASRYGVKP